MPIQLTTYDRAQCQAILLQKNIKPIVATESCLTGSAEVALFDATFAGCDFSAILTRKLIHNYKFHGNAPYVDITAFRDKLELLLHFRLYMWETIEYRLVLNVIFVIVFFGVWLDAFFPGH